MMASPPKKVGVLKCCVCRLHRQKCVPTDAGGTERIWIEEGRQDKCARCAKLGHACSRSEYASPSEEGGLRSPTTLGKRRASEAAQPMSQGRDMAPIHTGLGVTGPSRWIEDDGAALQSRLREIDLRQEALSKLDEDLAIHVVDGDHEKQTRFKTLYEARNAIFHKVLGMLHLAKELAVRVEEAGNTTEAYIAYTRVLEGYCTLNMPACYEIRTILIRMAKLLWARGDEYRAQRLAWQALGSRDQLQRAQESDLEVLRDIAKSLLRTSPELLQLIQIAMIGHVPCNCNSLLPPLHAMVESNYASQVPGNVLQSGFHPTTTNDNTPESPIVGGVHAIMELLGEFTDADLDARDCNRQTLLHLAALRRKEGLGYAMMTRAKYDARLLHRLVNARDKSGQTVLTVAISSGCSLTFITALLDNGAEYEPGTMPLAMTPLQASCSIGSLEIVDLLLTRGANFDNAYPGSGTPYAIAQEQGHFDIADRLSDSSPGSLSPHTADESDSGG